MGALIQIKLILKIFMNIECLELDPQEKDSSKKLSVGDFTDEDFNYQYEWLSFSRNLDPINTKAYFSKKTSNGKVTRYNEVPYNIKMIP